MRNLLFLSFFIGLLSCTAPEPVTFYLVRHAEKDMADTTGNPPLTVAGLERAERVRGLLSEEIVSGIWSTKYDRNLQTVAPLAAAKNLTVRVYTAHDFQPLLDSLKQHGQGQTFVICGHSNTVLPMIDHLGGQRPQAEIAESEYDKMFKVICTGSEVEISTIIY